MARTRRELLGTLAVTPLLAGCTGDGGESDGSDGTDGASGDGTTTAGNAAVRVSSHDDLGDVLVDADGMTLYAFTNDEQGADASACTGDCSDSWPPLSVENPTAGADVTAELTTFEREGGDVQVAANGWPLYHYAQDQDPGDAEGQGVGDAWWVLGPDGTLVRNGGGGGTTTSGGGGGGYGGNSG